MWGGAEIARPLFVLQEDDMSYVGLADLDSNVVVMATMKSISCKTCGAKIDWAKVRIVATDDYREDVSNGKIERRIVPVDGMPCGCGGNEWWMTDDTLPYVANNWPHRNGKGD